MFGKMWYLTRQRVHAMAVAVVLIVILCNEETFSVQLDKCLIPKRQNTSLYCGHNVTLSSQRIGTILSPGFPNNYAKDLECDWYLKSDRNITLTIKELQVEEQEECSYDYVDIYFDLNSCHLRRFCGTVINEVLETNSTEILVHFNSDLTFEGGGFQIQYFTDLKKEISKSSCHQSYTKKQGLITSPNFPQRYPDNIHCFYHIQAGPKERIFLKFHDWDMESDAFCRYDYLTIYDGHSNRSKTIGKFCVEVPFSITSTQNHLFLEFKSDYRINERGFRATYSTEGFMDLEGNIGECSWSKKTESGTIKSPGYPNAYPQDSYCKITIIAPEKHFIKFVFENLDVESIDCFKEFVRIEEKSEKGTEIIFQSCESTHSRKVISSSSTVIVSFKSDSTVQLNGFELNYQYYEKIDNENVMEVSNGSVSSGFLTFPKSTTVPSGAKHAMSCIPVKIHQKVRWLKNDKELTETNLPGGMELSESSMLQILRMNAHYVGNYSCEIGEAETVHRKWFLLSLGSVPENCTFDFNVVPKDSNTTERIGRLLLRCRSKHRNTTITWERDGVQLINSSKYEMRPNGDLVLKKLERTDQGLYTCVARSHVTLCRSSVSAFVNIKRHETLQDVCGLVKVNLTSGDSKENSTIQGKIIGGQDAKPGSHPWQVMFWTNGEAFCGGALINERWVITAAHCFEGVLAATKNLTEVLVKLGKTIVDKEEEHEISRKIRGISIHPGFKDVVYYNDIALVILDETVAFNPYIIPICLANKSLTSQFYKERTVGTVVGWGLTKEIGESSNTLREIKVPVVNTETCRNSTVGNVTRSMFCAGYGRATVDSCRGDSGGPFAVERDGRSYLSGLVSWGEGCAREGKYGFYTKIDIFLDWINELIRNVEFRLNKNIHT